jgi:membrane-associated protein
MQRHRNRASPVSLRRSRMIRAPRPALAPVPPRCADAPMEGINWLDLFNAMDRFLVAIVERNVLLVYITLAAIFFSETGLVFMAFLPGDSLLFVAGAVSALPQAQAKGLNVYWLMLVITVAAILGNTLNYAIGAWLGKKVYDGTIGWIDQGALRRTHDFYERHGGKTVMIARFVPVVRSFAPLVAGASGMDFRRFQLFNVLGAIIWVVSLVYGGYLFGNVPIIRDNLGIILIVGIGAVLVPLTLAALLRLLRRRTVA